MNHELASSCQPRAESGPQAGALPIVECAARRDVPHEADPGGDLVRPLPARPPRPAELLDELSRRNDDTEADIEVAGVLPAFGVRAPLCPIVVRHGARDSTGELTRSGEHPSAPGSRDTWLPTRLAPPEAQVSDGIGTSGDASRRRLRTVPRFSLGHRRTIGRVTHATPRPETACPEASEVPTLSHSSQDPLILLLHDGELRDIRALFDTLGIPVRERVGPLRPAEAKASWQTVVATPKRLLEFKVQPTGVCPTLVAIADQASKTLKSQMQRLRIHYVVNRPVHPMALRLLLLHSVYNGPERRKRDRVSIGADVRIKSGLFAKPATLAEISQRGARIVTPHLVAKGSKLRIGIGRELTKSGTLRLSATVVRTAAAEDGGIEAGLRFDDLGSRTAEQLRRFIDLHRRGPVQVRHQLTGDGTISQSIVEVAGPLPPIVPPGPSAAAPVTAGSAAQDTTDTETSASASAQDDSDRRGAQRHAYDSRVVALVDEAARVFLGRDISTGGMRVDTHPELGIGFQCKLALHAGPRSEPVLVEAMVDRDDGEEGVFLRFLNLTGEIEREIEKMMRRLDVSSVEGDEGNLVVSELIEVQGAAP